MSDSKKAHAEIRGEVFTQQIGYHQRRAAGSLRRLVSMSTAMGLDASPYTAALAALEPPIAPSRKPLTVEEANARALARRNHPWKARAVVPKRSRGVQ